MQLNCEQILNGYSQKDTLSIHNWLSFLWFQFTHYHSDDYVKLIKAFKIFLFGLKTLCVCISLRILYYALTIIIERIKQLRRNISLKLSTIIIVAIRISSDEWKKITYEGNPSRLNINCDDLFRRLLPQLFFSIFTYACLYKTFLYCFKKKQLEQ